MGKSLILRAASRYGDITFESLNLSWFGSQEIKGVKARFPDFSVNIPQATSPTSLFDIALHRAGDLEIEGAAFDADPIHLKEISASAEISSQETLIFKISGLSSDGELKGAFAVDGKAASPKHLDLTAKLEQFPIAFFNEFLDKPIATLALGDALNGSALVKIDPKHVEAMLDLKSSQMSLHLETTNEGDVVSLKEPAIGTLRLRPLFFKEAAGLEVLDEVAIDLKLSALTLPSQNQNLASFSAHFDVSPLKLPDQTFDPVSIDFSSVSLASRKFQIAIQSPHIENVDIQSFELQLFEPDRAHISNDTFQLDLRKNKETLFIKGHFQDFLFPFIQQRGELDIMGKVSPKAQEISLKAENQTFSMSTSLLHKDGILRLTKPGLIQLTITPEMYLSYNEESLFALTAPVHLDISIGDMVIPDGNLNQSQLQIDMKAHGLSFTEIGTGHQTPSADLSFDLNKKRSNSPFEYTLGASVSPKGSLLAKGVVDPIDRDISFDLKILKFPTQLFDLLLHSIGKNRVPPSAVFGSFIDADIVGNFKDKCGPLKAKIDSPQASASLNGQLTNGTLTLNEPLYAQIDVTPELGDKLIEIDTLHSDAPITFQINHEGFSLPVLPYNPENLQILHGRLDLGRIVCKNEGNLANTTALLRMKLKDDTVGLWFSPFDFHIKDGLGLLERTDFLIGETYHLCTWGDFDLVNNRIDMIFGITRGALQRAFDLKHLPPDYVLQIPVTGNFDDIDIDTAGATKSIAALVVSQHKFAAGGLAAGPAGVVLGGVLDRIAPSTLSSKATPPPRRPYPWELAGKSIDDEPEEAEAAPTLKKHKKKAISSSDKPLKQILRILK
jgi:hypothetical protein